MVLQLRANLVVKVALAIGYIVGYKLCRNRLHGGIEWTGKHDVSLVCCDHTNSLYYSE